MQAEKSTHWDVSINRDGRGNGAILPRFQTGDPFQSRSLSLESKFLKIFLGYSKRDSELAIWPTSPATPSSCRTLGLISRPPELALFKQTRPNLPSIACP